LRCLREPLGYRRVADLALGTGQGGEAQAVGRCPGAAHPRRVGKPTRPRKCGCFGDGERAERHDVDKEHVGPLGLDGFVEVSGIEWGAPGKRTHPSLLRLEW
jgi:hypothetical protein